MKKYFFYRQLSTEHHDLSLLQKLAKEVNGELEKRSNGAMELWTPDYLDNSEEHQRLLKAFKKYKIDSTPLGHYIEWTEDEYLGAELLLLRTRNFQRNVHSDDIIYDTQYDKSGVCPRCHAPRKIVGSLCIDLQSFHKCKRSIAHDDIQNTIVNKKFIGLVKRHKLTGMEFKPVRDYLGRESALPPAFQFFATNVLPKTIYTQENMKNKKYVCKRCKRVSPPTINDFKYSGRDLERNSVMDFNFTDELWPTIPLLIVTQKVYRTFMTEVLEDQRWEIIDIL